MKKYKLSNGEHFWERDGWLYFEEGRKMNYFSPQPLAIHALDYRYTYGGDIYREACEIVWKEKKG